jgi:P4 family phage/plasmid primase-like protien
MNSELIKSSISEFDSFLAKHVNKTATIPNILGMNGGSWYIPEKKYTQFLELYSKAWDKKPYYLVERRKSLFPFVMDIDMDSPFEDEINIVSVATEINEYMKSVINKPEFPYDYSVEGVLYSSPGEMDRLHIIYPNVKLSVKESIPITKSITQYLASKFPDFKKPWDKIVDQELSYKQLRMIGSHKWSHKENKDIERIYYPATIINDDIEINDEITNEHMLAFSLFHNSEGEIVTGKPREEVPSTEHVPKKYDVVDNDEISQLLSMLKASRTDDYKEWIEVGMCLKNINENNLNLWNEWSKQSYKYSEGSCERFWRDLKTVLIRPLSMGSLYYWAKMDNPEEYKKMRDNDLRILIHNSTNETHVDVAKVVYKVLQDSYVYVNSDVGSCWYKFEHHRWKTSPNGLEIKKDISDTIFKEYRKVISYYNDKITIEKDEMEQKRLSNIIKSLNSLSLKLKSTTFKNNLEKECREMFIVDKSFIEKLDQKQHLLGFNNGIYDLDNGEFRDGKPEDMVSLSTRTNYYPEIDPEIQKDIYQFFDDIMPNKGLAKYVLEMLAYQLHGNKYMEKISFWVGQSGRNGKGVLAALFMAALGEYCYCPDITLLTTKKTSSSSANSEMAKAKGKRAMILTEPSEDDKLQVGKMKSLSGNDKIQARALFKDFLEFFGQFHMNIQMNHKPDTNGFDQGFAQRLEIIPFIFKFCENPKGEFEKQVSDIKKKFTDEIKYAEQFMLILLQVYSESIKGGKRPIVPPEVLEATKEYLESINSVGNFITETFEVTNNKNDVVLVSEAFQLFKEYNKDTILKRNQFKQQMATNGFKDKKYNSECDFRGSYVFDGLKMKENNKQCEIKDDLDM